MVTAHGRGRQPRRSAALALAVCALALTISGEPPPRAGSPATAMPARSDEETALLARGERLYAAYCRSCHGGRDGGANHPLTPVHNHEGHTWHHADQNLMTIIMDGITATDERNRRIRGIPDSVPRMPAWKGILTEDDARAVLALIKTWWRPEQRASQERHSRATDSAAARAAE